MSSSRETEGPTPRRGSINRRELIAAAAASAAMLSGFRVPSARADTAATVKWGYNLPTRWDPVTSVTGYDIHLQSLAYSGLTRLDAKGAAQPALAQSWKFNGSGTELVFTLKPGLKFADGAPVDADAVRAHLDRARTQRDSSTKEPLEAIDHIVSDGPLAVRFVLNRADYQLPLILAGRPGLIASPKASPDKLAQWPVGAGPFKLIEVVPESYAYFVKDPDYWDAANIFIDRLELYVALDKTSIVSALSSGVYDISEINPNQVDQARRAGLAVAALPTTEARAVLVNINDAPFNDPKVVEALRYAINRQEFIDKITFGYAKPTNQPFPPTDPAFSQQTFDLWHYDLDKARKLLADAGHSPESLNVTIKGLDGPVLEVLQTQLLKLGITARIEAMQTAQVLTQIMGRRNAQIATNIGTQGRESPVLGLLAAYGTTGNLNLSAPYAPKPLLDAIDKVRATPLDSPDYLGVLHDAVAKAVTLNPSIWLYSSPRILAFNPKIRNLPAIPITYRWEGAKVAA